MTVITTSTSNKLIIANLQIIQQNENIEKSAAELVIANKELAYQNGEKKDRAAELVIANKELVFQKREKGKRAAEKKLTDIELKKQCEKLLNIAFLQSHQVRVPIANILGLFDLFNFETPSDPVNAEVLKRLKLIAESLDKTIQEILENTAGISSLVA